jgi:hypothetical protein
VQRNLPPNSDGDFLVIPCPDFECASRAPFSALCCSASSLIPLLACLSRPNSSSPCAETRLLLPLHSAFTPLHPAIRIVLFADDIRVKPDTRLAGWQNCFQLALDKLSEFAAEWRLAFSLEGEKSAIVYFRRPGSGVLDDSHRFPQQFTLCGQPLAVVEQYKYLGVWLQQSLSWEPHFQHLLARARFAAFQTQRLIPRIVQTAGWRARNGGTGAADRGRTLCGPHFAAVRALVMGVVYSRCTYGILFLSGRGLQEKLHRLQSVVVRPLRQVLGLPGNAHILSVLAEADCPAMSVFRQQLLLSYAQRVQGLPESHPARIHLLASYARHSLLAESPSPSRMRAAGITVDRKPLLFDILEAERDWGLHVLHKPSVDVIATATPPANTRRSRTRSSSGAVSSDSPSAACLRDMYLFQRVMGLSWPDAFTMATLLHARSSHDGHTPAALGPPEPAGPAASVTDSSAPSRHMGELGSLSDSVASLSATSNSSDSSQASTEPSAPVSLSQEARRRSFALWQQQQDGGKVLQTCKRFPGRSHYLYLEPRSTAVMRARLRLNRSTLVSSLFKRGLADSPLCPHPPCTAAGLEETADHVLLHCPRRELRAARLRCQNQLRRGCDMQLSLPLLLGSVQPTKLKEADPISLDGRERAPARPCARVDMSNSAHFSAPRAVWQPSAGLPRPIKPPRCASDFASPLRTKRVDRFRVARKALFITAAFLRAVRDIHGGVL